MNVDDDLEDKLYQLKEENFLLKKQSNNFNQNINFLTCKLNRLLEDKKRLLKRDKTRKEVGLEETIKDLELKIGLLTCENQRLQERELLLRTKLDTKNRKQFNSLYSHVRSRTDSGIGDRVQLRAANQPKSLHRSLSTFCLNRVSFPGNLLFQSESLNPPQINSSHEKMPRKNVSGEVNNKNEDNFHQRFQELQDEIIKLRHSVMTYLNRDGKEDKNSSNNKKLASKTYEKTSKSNYKHLNASFDSHVHDACSPETVEQPNSSLQNVKDEEEEEEEEEDGKLIQVFHPSSDSSSFSPPLKINLDQNQQQISSHVSSISKQLLQAKEKIKKLERQMLTSKSYQLKLEEYEKKMDILNKENDILQQSLAKCIGTCVSEIIKDPSLDDNLPLNSQQSVDHYNRIKLLDDERKKLLIDLQTEADKNSLLQSKYTNLKQSYNSIVNKSEKDKSQNGKDFSASDNPDSISGINNNYSQSSSSSKSETFLRKVIEERDSNLQNVSEIINYVTNDYHNL